MIGGFTLEFSLQLSSDSDENKIDSDLRGEKHADQCKICRGSSQSVFRRWWTHFYRNSERPARPDNRYWENSTPETNAIRFKIRLLCCEPVASCVTSLSQDSFFYGFRNIVLWCERQAKIYRDKMLSICGRSSSLSIRLREEEKGLPKGIHPLSRRAGWIGEPSPSRICDAPRMPAFWQAQCRLATFSSYVQAS